MFLLGAILLAVAQTEATDPAIGSEVWDGGGYMALMLLLIIMIGLLGGLFFVVKRVGLPKLKGGGKLELLETRPLGSRQFIVVGKYGEERFLLGVCPGKIDFLCRLKDPEIDAESLLEEFQSGDDG